MILVLSAVALLVFGGALRVEDAACRRAAWIGIAGLCCALTGQTVFGWSNPWPVVFGDLVLGGGLLWLAAVAGRGWVYVEVGLCAAMLLVHSLLLQEAAPTIVHVGPTRLDRAELVDSIRRGLVVGLSRNRLVKG